MHAQCLSRYLPMGSSATAWCYDTCVEAGRTELPPGAAAQQLEDSVAQWGMEGDYEDQCKGTCCEDLWVRQAAEERREAEAHQAAVQGSMDAAITAADRVLAERGGVYLQG